MVLGHPSRSALSTPRAEPAKSCAGDAVLRTSTRGTVHMMPFICSFRNKNEPHGTVRWATEDSISQCTFLQMTYTAENPHADGNTSPGARPRYRPPRHRDLHATSRTHDNWTTARQTSCRQQTAPPQPRCSKDVTAHPHRPGARPGRPCPVPACSGQPLSGRRGFSPAFGTEFRLVCPSITH